MLLKVIAKYINVTVISTYKHCLKTRRKIWLFWRRSLQIFTQAKHICQDLLPKATCLKLIYYKLMNMSNCLIYQTIICSVLVSTNIWIRNMRSTNIFQGSTRIRQLVFASPFSAAITPKITAIRKIWNRSLCKTILTITSYIWMMSRMTIPLSVQWIIYDNLVFLKKELLLSETSNVRMLLIILLIPASISVKKMKCKYEWMVMTPWLVETSLEC